MIDKSQLYLLVYYSVSLTQSKFKSDWLKKGGNSRLAEGRPRPTITNRASGHTLQKICAPFRKNLEQYRNHYYMGYMQKDCAQHKNLEHFRKPLLDTWVIFRKFEHSVKVWSSLRSNYFNMVYTQSQFIRNAVNSQLVPFLIFSRISTSFCFLIFEDYMVDVS